MAWLGAHAGTPRIKGAICAVVLASAGLLLSASLSLARDAITGGLTLAAMVGHGAKLLA